MDSWNNYPPFIFLAKTAGIFTMTTSWFSCVFSFLNLWITTLIYTYCMMRLKCIIWLALKTCAKTLRLKRILWRALWTRPKTHRFHGAAQVYYIASLVNLPQNIFFMKHKLIVRTALWTCAKTYFFFRIQLCEPALKYIFHGVYNMACFVNLPTNTHFFSGASL